MTTPAPLKLVWTADEVTSALFMHFSAQSWAPLTEVQMTPPLPEDMKHIPWHRMTDDQRMRAKPRRIDMLCIRRARKPGIGEVERLAIEVKVTRSDFLTDARDPYKQEPWRAVAHRHAYAVPEGLVKPDEVPAGSGLLSVRRWGPQHRPDTFARVVEWARRAPYNNSAPLLPDWLVLVFAHRAASSEGRIKGLLGAQQGADPDALRAEIERLTRDNDRLAAKLDRESGSKALWRKAFGAVGGIPCSTCGQPVRPKSIRQGSFNGWVHVDKHDEPPCLAVRTARADEDAHTAYANAVLDDDAGNKYSSLHSAQMHYPDEPWRYFRHIADPSPVDYAVGFDTPEIP